jgi:hypothetical protein
LFLNDPGIVLDSLFAAWYKLHIENGYQNQIMQKKPSEHLGEYLSGQGLKSTTQRDSILDIFINAGEHLSADELYARVKKVHPGIGYATVYRTLKLFAEAGLAQERRFEDGFTRYELRSLNSRMSKLKRSSRTLPGRTGSRFIAISWRFMVFAAHVKKRRNDLS